MGEALAIGLTGEEGGLQAYRQYVNRIDEATIQAAALGFYLW